MAEMVSSAVVGETVNQIFSGLIDKHEERSDQTEQMERLEMAHIKLEAALETSGKWQINDASLLRWRHKLKRAAQECDVAVRKCKQRAVEDEEKEEEVRRSSFPRRLAHATKSLVTGFFRRDTDTDGGAAVRRFEWFADGANEFLRFVELGGTPRGYMFFDPLIGRLLAGQELRYRLVRGSQYHLFCVRPISFEDRGVEAKMLFVYEDDEAPEKNLCLGSILRLSESTDVVGITIKCLQLVTPHFRSTAESARKELAGLPTQDFSWVPYLDSSHKDHWNSIHSSLTQWFRPNPLCCKQQHDELQPCSSTTRTTRLSDVSLEPVIEVFLQRHIPLSEYNVHRSKSSVQGERGCLKDVPHLKLGLLFSPHGSSEDLVPAVESSAIEVIDGEEQSGMHTNISLEQLDEVMLPKAIDCLYKRPQATAYQMFWKSKHGTAFLQVEKTSLVKIPPTKIGEAGTRRLAIQRRRDPKLERWIQVVIDFLNLWVAHAPHKLQSSFVEWIHKANEMKQAPQQRTTTS